MSKEATNSTKEARKSLTVQDIEPEFFNADGKIKFMTSNEMCLFVNDYFRCFFPDYDGCTMELANGNYPTFSLYFKHIKQNMRQDGVPYACEPAVSMKEINESKTNLVLLYKSLNNAYKNGNRYIVTEDGQDIILPLLTPDKFGKNNKPNWNTIISEFVDNSLSSYRDNSLEDNVLTKIVGIDANKIAKLRWGEKDPETGAIYQYATYAISTNKMMNGYPVPMSNVARDYNLQIIQADNNQLQKSYRKLGLGNGGSVVVRDYTIE